MTPEPLRIGLVGTGWVAGQHMSGYAQALGERARVVAVCDTRREVLDDFASRHGISDTFDRPAEMIATADLDILALLTPPAVRDEIIYPALDNGVNLLIEKPFAKDGAKAVEYVRAAEQAGVRLAVGQNFRWFPEYQWLHDRLAGSDTGSIGYLEARSFQDRPQPPDQWRAAESKLEMAIFSVHLIDRLQWLAPGSPVGVSATTRRDEASGLPGEQFTALTAWFDDGAVATMVSSWMSKALPVNELRVDTTTGTARVAREHPMRGEASGDARFNSGPAEHQSFPEEPDHPHGPLTYGLSMRAFVDAIIAGEQPPHSGRDNLRTMGIMEAAYLSAGRGGSPVTVAEALGHDGLVGR